MREQKSQAIDSERNAKHQEGKFCFGHDECVTLRYKDMQLEDFLKNQNYFSLGHLPTEKAHPKTLDLSNQAKVNLKGAIQTLQGIDRDALSVAKAETPLIQELAQQIQMTFENGKRVYLSGCGATGRLALALESLHRKLNRGLTLENQVQALMAGGDFALVKSVENFEDYPEFGIRHLYDLGFSDGDLLIAITEGGETPYVIGTVNGALARSSQDPWFVFCNPKEILVQTVPRAREVIENPRVRSLCLNTGPMALSGSTRLQAASVQMLAVGAAFFGEKDKIPSFIENLLSEYSKLDLASFLLPIIEWENARYKNNEAVVYESDAYPIAVLTDTTERSPTFSLTPFEKSNAKTGPYSWCYLSIPDAQNAQSAWLKILNRRPLGLEWLELQGRVDQKSILEFDFGKDAKLARKMRLTPKIQADLSLHRKPQSIEFKTDSISSSLTTPLLAHPLSEQLLIKMILNTLSLLVMGRLDRFEGNVMTWVRANNGKLMDRTLRYLEHLIEQRGLPMLPREELIRITFAENATLGSDEALILKVLESLTARKD